MRISPRQALRVVSTIAGVTALAAAFTGTATADPSDEGFSEGDIFGSSESSGSSAADDEDFDREYEQRSPDVVDENLDGETMSPSIEQPGLLNFDAPTLDTQ